MSVRLPRVHIAPDSSTSFGDLGADLSADYGLAPDDWQRLVLDDWLADSRGRWASLTCGLAVPRQNGKNALLEMRELFGTVGRGERILHTAHEVKTAQKHFRRLMHFFGQQAGDPAARYPELNELVAEVRKVNGQEAVFLKNGGSVELVARSKNSGRGFTVDVLVMDEAQELSEDALEALMPTTSAAPLGNPQWIFTGTPPGPKAVGEVFTRVRAEALGTSRRLTWHEWSADGDRVENIRLSDHRLWRAVNPALGTRLQMDVVEGERARFSDEGFARERLGWWKPVESSLSAIPIDAWMALAEPEAERGAFPSFAVATAPDRSWAAVAVAWRRSDGLPHVMLADYRPDATWVPGRIAELRARWGGPVLVDQASRGLIEGAVEVSQVERAKADNALSDAVLVGLLRHGNEAALNTAVRGAQWRPVGDTRLLDRKGSLDISPLAAASLANWSLVQTPDYDLLDSVR